MSEHERASTMANEVFVIRPAPAVLRSWWWRGLAVVVTALVAFGRYLVNPHSRVTAVVLLILLLGAIGVGFRAAVANCSLFVDASSIGRSDWLGRRTSYPRGSVSSIIRQGVPGGMGSLAQFTVVVDRNGRSLVALQLGGWYAPEDKAAFLQRLALPVEERDGQVALQALVKEFPGALTRWYRGQMWLGVAAAAAVVFAMMALIVAGRVV